MLPILFAIEEARSMEMAAIMLVTKNNEPSLPPLRSNLSLKKNVTQDLNCHLRILAQAFRKLTVVLIPKQMNPVQRVYTD
jgi:hypothetical protein